MKKMILLILLIAVTKSYGQFFENELNYLVFDKQDSLIKANKVKIQEITGFILDHNLEKEEINNKSEYNSKGFLITDKANCFYSYNEFNKLSKKECPQKVETRKEKKEANTSEMKGWNFYSSRIEKEVYTYDTINRLKIKDIYEVSENNRFIRKKVYTYSKDTTIIVSFFNNLIINNVKKLTQTSNSKTVLSIDDTGFTNYHEKLLDEKKLMLVEKRFYNKKIRYSTTYFIDTDYKILKKETIRPLKTFNRELNVWEQFNTKDFCSYVYNDKKKLIEKKELLKSVSGVVKKRYNITKFNYYDSGLLKEITALRKDGDEKDYKEISHKQYNYQFHN